ncbi:MAG: calcium/proton exchanger [Thermoplasmata archaeon]
MRTESDDKASQLGGGRRTICYLIGFLFLASVVLILVDVSPVATFVMSAITIIPLAYFMGVSTEELGKRLGPGSGGLLNATFGNATELIIALFALQAGLHTIVKASLTGSIIGNILFVLGLSMLTGGLKHKTQRFERRAAGTSSTMLAIAVVALTIPAMATFTSSVGNGNPVQIEDISIWTAALLLVVYFGGLVFSLYTHRRIFNPVAGRGEPEWSVRMALGALLASTILVAIESEFLVGAIESSSQALGLNELFVGVIIIALIGNAAEHGGAVMMARKNKMNLSVQIATSSGTQIALFVAPILVFASLLFGAPMTLDFGIFEVVTIALSVAIVHMVSSDGESNWFEGAMLVVVYLIVAVGFFYHP